MVLNLLCFQLRFKWIPTQLCQKAQSRGPQEYDAVHIHWNTRSPLKMMFSARPRFCLLPVGLISKVVTTAICHTQGETMSVILQCSKLNVQKTYGFSVPDLTQFYSFRLGLNDGAGTVSCFHTRHSGDDVCQRNSTYLNAKNKICIKNTERLLIYTTLSAAAENVSCYGPFTAFFLSH